ncbi:MAG: DUF2202 domain-containing protein [Gammaproteobacteria bacterium]|nr:DUF2202 domain-containing protein [Gammaproteobacteria bacterium]
MNIIKPVYMAIGISLAVAACSDTDSTDDPTLSVNEQGYSEINPEPLQQDLQEIPAGELSEEEISGLLYMREEEKLAHDVYRYLFDVWNQNVFDNIADSEQTHTDAVKALLVRYALTDPAEGKDAGQFENPELQQLYDSLVAEGEASLIDALMVGAAIEEIDIIDIAEAMENIEDNDDIVLVYDNLMKGSRNHLRALVKNLSNNGITYEPRYLSQEEYDSIVNSDIEKGSQ